MNLGFRVCLISYICVVCYGSSRYDSSTNLLRVVYKDHHIVKREANSSDDAETTESTTNPSTTQNDIITTQESSTTTTNVESTSAELTTNQNQSDNQTTVTDKTTTQSAPSDTPVQSSESENITDSNYTTDSVQTTASYQTTASGHTTNSGQTTEPVNITTETDSHVYYKSKLLSDPDGNYWNELQGHTRHEISNDHHLTFSFITLSFKFPFYGHLLDRFAITTQGFLYMSSFSHPSLDFSFTHYLAPLMANFDTIGDYSHVLYKDDGTRFVAEWRSVELNDQESNGNYTFQTTLFANGTILFSYKEIPETNISEAAWPVKVGLSDAFYYDVRNIFGTIRIVSRYHVVSIDVGKLGSNMAIILDPIPTCNLASTCAECTALNISFSCSWCSSISRCSDGLDRHRQDWIDSNCDSSAVTSLSSCPYTSTTIATTLNSQSTTTTSDPNLVIIETDNTGNLGSSASKPRSGIKKITTIVVPMIVALALIFIFIGAWCVYARTHPNTKSGRWLIQHRPRNLKEKFYSIRFFKDKDTDGRVRFGSEYEREDTSMTTVSS